VHYKSIITNLTYMLRIGENYIWCIYKSYHSTVGHRWRRTSLWDCHSFM